MNDREIYKKGFIDGLKCYAHWENGEQQVGTCRRKLEDAIRNVEYAWNFTPILSKTEAGDE